MVKNIRRFSLYTPLFLLLANDPGFAACRCDCVEGGTGISKASFNVDTFDQCKSGCVAASASAHSLLTPTAPTCLGQGNPYERVEDWCSNRPVPANAKWVGGVALGTNNHTGNRHGEVCFDLSRIGKLVNTWCYARQGSMPNQLCVGVETSSTCGDGLGYLRRDGGHVLPNNQACIW